MKYVVDTNIINRLVDGTIRLEELPTDGTFVACHIQIDEINRTKNPERRKKLLEKFAETVDEILCTDSFIVGVSALGGAKLGDGESYELLKTELDSRNRNKPNNSHDALIAEIAMNNSYVLLTADFDLYQVAYAHGIGTIYWTPAYQLVVTSNAAHPKR
jgi:predicted nucleic acid-binding protein